MARLPAAHREHGYRCFLPDLAGFVAPLLRRAQPSPLPASFGGPRVVGPRGKTWRRGRDSNPRYGSPYN
jgi:hypothetical protein